MKTPFLSENNIFLKNEKCPIIEFMNEKRKQIPEERLEEFASLARVIQYNYIFLKRIILRIQKDVEINEKYWDAYYRLTDPYDEGLKITNDDKEVLSLGAEVLEDVHLDIANFFIHASIFVNQLTKISGFALKTQIRSLSRHRKKIENTQLPKEYKEFIEKMDWYDNHLKNSRDNFVVHPQNTFWAISTEGGKLTGASKFSFKKRFRQKIDYLKDKYSEITKDENYDTVLKKLRMNIEKLENNDKTMLEAIEKQWGHDFSSIDFVSLKIFEYMEFIQRYFKDKLQ
ncbi:MAG: hypothetical protein ACW9W4_07805 [Candidatus Nitrosopumilus sp. bin_7KS]